MKKIFLLLIIATTALIAFKPRTPVIISGVVTDIADQPISGATVTGSGSTNAVATDAAGHFTITLASLPASITVSAVGCIQRTVKVKSNQFLKIRLKQQQQNLEEVVVTGYGVADAQYELQGRAAGVAVQSQKIYGMRSPNQPARDFNTEDYDAIDENSFHSTSDDPLSTFSIDVDAASYSNVRRFLNSGQLPATGSVRVEEMINYFHYEYPQPKAGQPFSINTEIADCPWNGSHKLVLIGLQGKKIPVENLPATNLVFLIDVSGSMQDENKLPLVKSSLKMLVEQMRTNDRISLVVYAGSAGIVLNGAGGNEKRKILDAIDRLEAGGSTAGGEGIKLAYKTAVQNFIREGNNRVILCTDGDFNVGTSSDAELEKMIESERNTGVYLTVLGYGMGNYKDNKMQKLADKGNGNHAYIDSDKEAKKVLVNEFGGTLFTIAKDVKLQVEFNPTAVQSYRLVGYENRMLKKDDFNNDVKDAGELGSGHTVTALYEVIPVGVKDEFSTSVDPLKYSLSPSKLYEASEILTVKFRYKDPDQNKSKLIEHTVLNQPIAYASTSDNFRFAASVAEFGMLLTGSSFKQKSSFKHVLKAAKSAMSDDQDGLRTEFVHLVEIAKRLSNKTIQEEDDVASMDEE